MVGLVGIDRGGAGAFDTLAHTEDEVLLGTDANHLDFRASVRREPDRVVLTTVVPDTPGFHRREVEVLAALPSDLPVPSLLGSYDDGDWVALVVEDVDGVAPAEPWRPAELARVVEAMAGLADRLTPSPGSCATAGGRGTSPARTPAAAAGAAAADWSAPGSPP